MNNAQIMVLAVEASITGFPRIACPTCECPTCTNCTTCPDCFPLAPIVTKNTCKNLYYI